MSANVLTVNPKNNVRLRGVVLPVEHGSWGFLFESLVAAVAVAPSFSSVWISLMVIGAFLVRQPLKIFLTDYFAKRNLPQTAAALKFILIYGTIFLCGLAGSLIFAKLESFVPFLFVSPFAVYQIYCDVSRQSRQLLPELTGVVAISSSAPVIALAGGWTFPAALALWAIFVARLIPSILYVRNRLRLEKDKDFTLLDVLAAHFIAIGAIGILAGNGFASKLTLAMFIVLFFRAAIGLSPFRRKVKAMKIGVWEVIYGVLTVLSVIIGYYFRI